MRYQISWEVLVSNLGEIIFASRTDLAASL